MKKWVGLFALILLTLIYVNSFFVRQIIAVLGVDIRAAFDLSNLQIGLLYGTAFSFIYALAGIPMGYLADLYSRKWMITIGLLVWSVMTLISGFATSFAFLIVARLFVGLSQAMLSPAVYSYLADRYTPERRATIFSLYASGIFVGVGLSFLIGGTVAQWYDWRSSLIVISLPGLALFPLAVLLLREPERTNVQRAHPDSLLHSLRDILSKKTVRRHLIGFSFLACTGYTVLAFVGVIFNDIHNRPDLTSHYGWFLFGVAGMVILSGLVADRLGKKHPKRRFWMGILAAWGGVPFYIAGLFHSSAEMALMLLGIGVLFSSSYNGVAAALLQFLVTARQRALAGGLYLFAVSVAGFGAGPPITGFLSDRMFTGTDAIAQAVLAVMLICSAGATVALVLAMRSYNEDEVG
ncbi:MAG: spinster family MFS transporter [Balneolaceae bacterium]